MIKEAYRNGVLQALNDAGIIKKAAGNPGRMGRFMNLVGKHPEPFGALGGAGVGAGSTALGGGDVDDVLLGAGVGALAGGVGGMGLRALRNSKVIQAMRDRLAKVELESELNAIGIPKPSEAALSAEKTRLLTEG